MQYSPRPESKAGRTRARVLAAARELFARHGYTGATTRAIAARAGINVATLHYHFDGKRGLWNAALKREPKRDEPNAKLVLQELLAREDGEKVPDPETCLAALVELLYPGDANAPVRRTLLASLARSLPSSPLPPRGSRKRGRRR